MAAYSKLKTRLPYTCYEVGHTWTPYCSKAFTDIAYYGFKQSLKIYASFYIVAAILRGRKLDYYAKKLLPEIVQSSVFLSANACGFMGFFCFWRKIVGLYFVTGGYIPGLCCSFAAISMERKKRRGLLAVYMATVAADLLLRMMLSRGYVRQVNNAEVMLFSVMSAAYMFLFRCGSLKDGAMAGVRLIVGPDELPHSRKSIMPSSANKQVRFKLHKSLTQFISGCLQRIRQGLKHRTCPHEYGCLSYTLEGSLRNFVFGFAVQAAVKLVGAVSSFRKQPSKLLSALLHRDNLHLGAFLASFNGIFRTVNCLLRWIRNTDSQLHAIFSGFLAGWSMMIYKSATIAMYLTSKLCEILYFKGISAGYLPHIKWADTVLYSLSTALMVHAAVFEPHNIRPAYWKFLTRLTNSKFVEVNRRLVEGFGTNSALMAPDFWPKYDGNFTNLPTFLPKTKSF